MTVEMKLALTGEDVRSYSESNREPEWLAAKRSEAYQLAETLQLPKPDKTKIHNWNFTEFPVHAVHDEPLTGLAELPQEARALIDIENQKNIYVQRNNTPAYLKLSDELKEQGVILTDIFTAAREHSDLVQKYFMDDAVKVDEHKLTALHAAFMNGGVFVYVPKGVEVKEPVQVLFLHEGEEVSLFNHAIIVAEENSALTYVENYLSLSKDSKGLANIISEVIAKDGAKITYGAVDVLAEGFTSYINRRGVAGRDATIEWALGLMNDCDTIYENVTHLVGDGSVSHSKSVLVGRGTQKQNVTAKTVHWGKGAEGFILQHGVMKDEASTIFNGIGKIEHGASKSDAVQESRVLMLSEKARGDANPILLIDEDDVTAGHAASVGRVDPLQLYYLMSRGISRVEAERLIVHGFLAPVVSQLPIEGVKKQLSEVIERKVR
ncbi:Fe-S cluster assembly protein SufD [Bhargavaea beijingensis]|uniref:Fe-S cluster assembly protein SufD n=1 Tax=Bhargavaea beijingensis TaxID=426756 RepID=A0A1G7F2U9_9BACL|nr:Fe-S cluster assembly protein SufD [Bhargavaea beijingensis]MCW1927601.1 Fe-S cluster assembly protein SufD [Bhargavaea beijingensis]RSK24633.1 Fe-S cluster assembly protein SufD [Bhargavaea beijingensis]SDE70273.1 Fe-S cluster assembly protein SufD [Bhargavaea beijingensis]